LKHFGGFWGFFEARIQFRPGTFFNEKCAGGLLLLAYCRNFIRGATFDRAASRLRGPD